MTLKLLLSKAFLTSVFGGLLFSFAYHLLGLPFVSILLWQVRSVSCSVKIRVHCADSVTLVADADGIDASSTAAARRLTGTHD